MNVECWIAISIAKTYHTILQLWHRLTDLTDTQMEHLTTISPNGTVQIPPSMLKDLGFEPGMSIELHTASNVLEVRSAPLKTPSTISFGCMKNQIVMHDDLISPTNVDWYA